VLTFSAAFDSRNIDVGLTVGAELEELASVIFICAGTVGNRHQKDYDQENT